jgi:hypothetical protein
MKMKTEDFFTDLWATDKTGQRVYPYKGLKGYKKGLFSVNFTNDTKKFEGFTQEQLVAAVTSGKFKERGTIRMLPLNVKPGAERNAFAPQYYKNIRVKDFS